MNSPRGKLWGTVCVAITVLLVAAGINFMGIPYKQSVTIPRQYWSTVVGLEKGQEGELDEWLAPLRHSKLLGVRKVAPESRFASSLQLELPETM